MKKTGRSSRLAAWFLTAAMILSMLPASSFAENTDIVDARASQNEQAQSSEQQGQEHAEQGTDADAPDAQDSHVKSPDEVTEEDIIEREEDCTVYDLGGGRGMTVFYDAPVRFEGEDGKMTDYDPSLVEIDNSEGAETASGKDLTGYSHVNAAGDSRQYMPEILSKSTPVLMEKGGDVITMAPSETTMSMLGMGASRIRIEEEETTDLYDENVRLPLSAVYEAEVNGDASVDIIAHKNGNTYHIQVGKYTPKGRKAVARERRALEDLHKAGHKVYFIGYE